MSEFIATDVPLRTRSIPPGDQPAGGVPDVQPPMEHRLAYLLFPTPKSPSGRASPGRKRFSRGEAVAKVEEGLWKGKLTFRFYF